jgi:putative tryptophan/tyrosine transport system substrate-binding protein
MEKSFRLVVLVLVTVLMMLGLVACSAEPAKNNANPNSNATDIVPGGQQTPVAKIGADPTDVTDVGWFQLRADAAAYWKITLNPEDKNQFTLSLKDKTGFEGQEKRVMAIFNKKGDAFNLGLSVLANGYYQKRVPVEFTAVFYDNKVDKGLEAFKYAADQKFDLIYTMGSDVSEFAVKNYKEQPVPLVTVLSKDPVLQKWVDNYDSGSGTKIAYTSVGVPVELQVRYLRDLKPNLKNIGIIYERKSTSAVETQVTPLKSALETSGINMVDIVVEDGTKAAQELAEKLPVAVEKMKENDPEFDDSVFWVTASTPVIAQIKVINEGAGKVPVLSVYPELVKEGDDSAVLSFGVSWEAATKVAVAYGVDILSGKKKASSLPVGLVTPPDIAINFKKANQIGLKIPFTFFESASFIYDAEGKPVRIAGQPVQK